MTKRYFVVDVRNDREFVNYVQQIVNHVKNVSFDSIFHQFTWVWRNFDSKLKRDIDALDETTTLTQFLKKIEAKKKIWQNVYRNRSSQFDQRDRDRDDRDRVDDRNDQYSNNLSLVNQNNVENRSSFSRGFQNRSFQGQDGYYSNYANQNNQYYSSYNQQTYRSQYQSGNQPLNVPRIVASPSQRLIGGPAQPPPNGQQGGYDSKPVDVPKPDSRPYPDGRYPLQPRGNWQSNRPIGAYLGDAQAADASGETDENADWESHSGGFTDEYHGLEEPQEKPAWNSLPATDYTEGNHGHEYVDADFVGAPRVLEYTCRFCQQVFYSNNKLHRHIRDCRKTFPDSTFAAQHVSVKQPKSSKKAQIALWKQSVVDSTTSFDKNDEYEFRNWKYVTIKVTISYQNVMKNLCFNIECTMFLMNKK